MLNDYNVTKCIKVVQKHGEKNQILKLIEELAELSRAASDVLQYWEEYGLTENFVEELADVYVMCQQAQCIFDIGDDEINDMAEVKLDRTLTGKHDRTWRVRVAFMRCDSNKAEYEKTYNVKAETKDSAERTVYNGLSMLEFSNFKIVNSWEA